MSSDKPAVNDSDTLYDKLVVYITSSYGELDNYSIELVEDVLSTGVHRVQAKIKTARGWANRVLSMLREASRWKNTASSMAEGKQLLFERKVTTYIRDTQWTTKIGADERKSQAQLQFISEQDEAKKWQDLTSEMRALADACEKKHKDLINTKDDIKALLWSARLQFVLETGNMSQEGHERQAQLAKPVFEPSDDRDDMTKLGVTGSSIDELLQGKS